jgi:hypothetical protein
MMSRSRRLHASVLVVALSGVLAAIVGGDSNALGPVSAVTPTEVQGMSNTQTGYAPVVSGRGEAIGVRIFTNRIGLAVSTTFQSSSSAVAFTKLDEPGADPAISGDGITVSGDQGCVAVSAAASTPLVFRYQNRCTGADSQIPTAPYSYTDASQLALSHTGQFLAIQLASSADPLKRVFRVDTQTGEMLEMPQPPRSRGFAAEYGLDISDDGRVIVVPALFGEGITMFAWDLASNAVTAIGPSDFGGGGWAAFPSMSADGRFVSFSASHNLTGVDATGPWIYVIDRSTSVITLISNGGEAAFQSSMTRDGTQIAYAVNPGQCSDYNTSAPTNVLGVCPPGRIDVAYGSQPGLAGGSQKETVSTAPDGAIVGNHFQPSISGNGRWVAWVSNVGDQLLGTAANLDGFYHVFRRQRDAILTVDPRDFGTLTVNTSAPALTTVRNTGRTTVTIATIAATPGQFSTPPGGTCAIGTTLPPGGSCTVNVRLTVGATPGTFAGSLTVSESGFDAIFGTGPLTGASRVGPTIPPAATTTTTTSPPGSGTPRPTTTTTTTIPKNLFLDATPNPIDFGQVAIGIPTAPQTVTVTNTGSASGQLFVSIFGDHPDDFEIVGSTCEEVILAPAATCTVDIRMNARDGGDRTALATITTTVGTVEVVLRGQGRFSPRLAASPQAVTDRSISTIIGQGFPPADPVLVQILGTPISFNVTPDTEGKLRIPFSPLGKLPLGSYTLHVDGLPTVYELIETQLVVVLPTFKPQGPTGPAFGTSLLVTRGG